MASYDEGAGDFVLMCLVHDPLLDLAPALAENVKSLQAVGTQLEQINPRSECDICENGIPKSAITNLVCGPDPVYDITQISINQASIPAATVEVLQYHHPDRLIEHQSALIAAQTRIRQSICEEIESRRSDQEKANGRRYDFGPLAFKLANILTRKEMGGKEGRARKRQRLR